MRTLALLLFMRCGVGVLVAQQQPQFIMPIWFEDAVGNKDTIWVGGDPNASSQYINPQFGEVAITTSFDSVFEVRAVHGDDYDWETSKLIVDGNTSLSQCYLGAHTRIMIHAKYLPVQISWDTVLLQTNFPCNINTVLTPDILVFLLQHWYEARVIYCMMTHSSIEEDFDYPGIPLSQLLSHDFEVEGQGIKRLPGLWFSGFWDVPHCYTTLPAQEPIASDLLWVSPNPATDDLLVQSLTGEVIEEIQVLDIAGRVMGSYLVRAATFDLTMHFYPPGIYYLQLRLSNGRAGYKKIVKL